MSNPNTVILIPSCQSYRNRENLCRKVWFPSCERLGWPVEVYDEGEQTPYTYHPKYEQRRLQYDLSSKVQRMFTMAVKKYPTAQWFVRIDTDTMFWPERLDLNKYNGHYIGNHWHPPLSEPFMFYYCIGFCYVLSGVAARLVSAATMVPKDFMDGGWAEDRFVGRVMHEHSIPIILEPRMAFNENWDENKFIAWHHFGRNVGKAKFCPYLAEGEIEASF